MLGKLLKSVLALGFVLAPVSAVFADETIPLRDHMVAMSYLVDDIYAKSESPKFYPEAADSARELRSHLMAALGLLPPKVMLLKDAREKRLMEAEYQQIMSRMIYLTAAIERLLLTQVVEQSELESVTREVFNLLREVSITMGKAHARFRD